MSVRSLVEAMVTIGGFLAEYPLFRVNASIGKMQLTTQTPINIIINNFI